MERIGKHRKKILALLVVLIFVVGMCGFIKKGDGIWDALFNTLILYITQYPQETENNWLFAVRFISLAFAGVAIISLLYDRILKYNKIIKAKKAVVIFGNNEEGRKLFQDLTQKKISAILIEDNNWCYPALKYVLLDSEEENLAYYSRHKKILHGIEIHIKTNNMSGLILCNDKVRFFSMEELMARHYWLEYKQMVEKLYIEWGIKDLESSWKKVAETEIHISIIGRGNLGRELIFYAPQYNVIHPGQTIIYHVFTDEKDMKYLNPSWEKLGIVFENGEWYEKTEILRESYTVILAEQSNTIQLAQKIRSLIPEVPLDIITLKDLERDLYYENRSFSGETKVGVYSLYDKSFVDLILEEDSILAAKQLNDAYMSKNLVELVDVGESEKNRREKAWNQLDTFTKYSNISSADYRKILKKIIQQFGFSMPLKDEEIEFLAELEHIRWMNYHFSNGWIFDEELSQKRTGQRKNKECKRHGDLRPYDELDDETKDKDRDNIKKILETLN